MSPRALLLLAAACALAAPLRAADADANAPAAPTGDAVWVALHIAVGQGQDEYFALVAATDLAQLRAGDAGPAFVLARRVCSLDDDGKLQDYADDDRGSDVWFRAQDVRRVALLKRDPHTTDREDHDEVLPDAVPRAPGAVQPRF